VWVLLTELVKNSHESGARGEGAISFNAGNAENAEELKGGTKRKYSCCRFPSVFSVSSVVRSGLF